MKSTCLRWFLTLAFFIPLPALSVTYVSSITSGDYYHLYNAYQYGTNTDSHALTEVNGLVSTSVADNSDYLQLWQITKSGTGYTLKNAVTGHYIQVNPGTSTQFYMGISPALFYTKTKSSTGITCFAFDSNSAFTGYNAIHCAESYNVVGWSFNAEASYWKLEKVVVTSAMTTAISALKAKIVIDSGSYYRLNSYYEGRSMVSGGSKLTTAATDASAYAQIWKIDVDDSNCSRVTLQNALTDEYIQTSPGTSEQYVTGSTAYPFATYSKASGSGYVFSFKNTSGSTNHGLHCAATQSYNVVGWDYTSDASYWTIEKVNLTIAQQEELANIKTITATDYTETLQTFFSDYACTTLKSNYASMSDAQLRSAMGSLPTALQDMAVSVKNNKWDSSKDDTWNSYAKDFRIHEYEIFSNCNLWYNKLKVGRFSHLFHPTGIKVNMGDYIYLYVEDGPKDTSASLQVEFVEGVNREGTAYNLKKGYNAFYVPVGGEVFISYILNNVDSSCSDYPDIKVHIEGGTCNGCFDMRGHNHTNEDWAWLKSNMFTDEYLHVKGNSALLNVHRSEVIGESNAVGVMNIWDFIFDKLQSLVGCDQWKSSGKYKMMVNSFRNDDQGSYPFWNDTNHGSSHPNLSYASGLFNYNSLANVGKNGGQIWEVAHELGHGHQGPINMAGCTEVTNNSLVQCVTLLAKDNIGTNMFQTTRSSRGEGVKAMASRFNDGYSWIDLGSMRTQSGAYNDVWLANRFIYQLWLYFDYMGNYQPTGGNTGFSFMTALYDKLRENGLAHSGDSSNPGLASKDYLLIAKYASQITQTDLREFFQVWGFWELSPTVSRPEDIASANTWYMGDYYNYYLKTDANYVAEVKNVMAQYSTKASNIMFLEDRCTGSTLPTYNGASVSTFGETGYYETYGASVTGTYKYTTSGTKVTISGDGAGAVGFKVYDDEDNLVAISNTKTFTVRSDVATGLASGAYRMVAAQGDGNDVAVPSTGAKAITYILKYEGTEVGRVENVMVIPNSSTEANMPEELKELGNFGDWMAYTYSPATTTSSTTIVNVTATWNGPFDISTNYDDASWYKLRQRADEWGIIGYVTYDSEKEPNIILPSTNADTDVTKWAFIGNPYTGLTIVNKAAGSGLKLVSESPVDDGNTGGNTYATMGTDGTYSSWFITPSPYHKDGFFISNSDGYAFNWRSANNLAYWTGGKDRGSTFTVWDISDYLPGITDLANLSNNKAYFITNARRTWMTKSGEEEYSLGSNAMFEPTMMEEQFAIIKYNGSYYLYSITAQQFLTNTGKFSDTPQMISITPTNNETYPWLFSFDDTHIININSDGNVVINGWNTIDAGNSNAIIEMADFNPSYALSLLSNTIEVTYNLVYNGEVIFTGVIIKEIGSTPDISDMSGWDNGLMSYSYDVESITASTNVVNITATWNGPFQISTLDKPKWYVLKLQGNKYPTFVSDGTPNVKLPTTPVYDDTQMWAFIGNPYSGLSVINKMAGTDVRLVSDSPANDGNTGGNTYATLSESGTCQEWIPFVSTHYEGAFYLFNTEGYALNFRSNDNLAYWTSGYGSGSSFTVEDPETYPTAGKYRIKSHCGRYMTYSETAGLVTTTDADDQNTIVTLTGTYPNFKMSIAGLNVQGFATYSTQAEMTVDEGNTVVFTKVSPDYWTIYNTNGTGELPNYRYMHEDGSYKVVGWESSNNNSWWIFEKASVIGDVNGDGQVSIADVTALVNIILGKDNTQPYQYDHEAADVNGDGSTSIADVTALVNIILGKN